MIVRRYYKPGGVFDYSAYRIVQMQTGLQKVQHVWAIKENIIFLATYIRGIIADPTFGLCHGTRQGKEQEWLARELGCRVLGTEISETAKRFPNTIQWDFHRVRPEWRHACDFIYSNSLDHSYDPHKCLDAWMSCLRPHGVCAVEHTSKHETGPATESDIFKATIAEMPGLIEEWGAGRYAVREILDTPAKHQCCEYSKFIVLQNLAELAYGTELRAGATG